MMGTMPFVLTPFPLALSISAIVQELLLVADERGWYCRQKCIRGELQREKICFVKQFGRQRSPAGPDEMYRRKIKYTKKQTQAVSGEDIKVEVG